ncbi:MAG: hypothetical protein SGPRY_003621, partial [Prymnesium sp.]
MTATRRGGWPFYFKVAQVAGPLLPIPLGCYFLYKAIASFNRSPPPIATDAATAAKMPMYGEPIYQASVEPCRSGGVCHEGR